MELFFPSKKILETIACTVERPRLSPEERYSHHIQHFTFTPASSLPLFAENLLHLLGNFYGGLKGIESLEPELNHLLVYEGLKNAKWHGSRNKGSFTLGLFLGRQGLCYGFQDAGDYFKSEDTKRKYERKISLLPTEFSKDFVHIEGNDAPGFERGTEIIYDGSDIIEVDTKAGVLYCVQLIDRILKK